MKKLKKLVNKPLWYTLVAGLLLPMLTLLVGGLLAGIFVGIIEAVDYMMEWNAIFLIVFSIIMAIWVKKSLGDGFFYGLGCKGLGIAMLVALPMLAESVSYIVQGALAEIRPELNALDFLCPLVTGIQPGVLEELFFRGMVFGGLMHFRAGKKNRVLVAFLASSLSFSFIHMVNMLDGQSFIGTVNQLLFAFAIGSILCASYLRSRNLWAAIFYHSLHDAFAFFLLRTTNASGDGAPSYVQLVIYTLTIVYACYIIFSTKPEQVDELWGAAKPEALEEAVEL